MNKKAAAMHEATDIGTLIERVESATGSDRDLDLALVERFGTRHPNGVYSCAGTIGIPWFTGSIDAAVRLVEEVKPGCNWARDEEGEVSIGPAPDGWWMAGRGLTVPLAILSALLRSIQENQT